VRESCLYSNGLGVRVDDVQTVQQQILRGFDDQAAGLIADSMTEAGYDIHLRPNIVEMGWNSQHESRHAMPANSDAAMGAKAEAVERVEQQRPHPRHAGADLGQGIQRVREKCSTGAVRYRARAEAQGIWAGRRSAIRWAPTKR